MPGVNSSPTHPQEVFQSLLEQARRKQKREKLETLHELCEAQHRSSKDFSYATISKLWKLTGGNEPRALYNSASADYRVLIDSRANHCGVNSGKIPRKERVNREGPYHQLLKRIDDSVVRGLVQAALLERDKLRQEVRILKPLVDLRIDRAPRLEKSLDEPPAQNSAGSLLLTPSEREALTIATSAKFLADECWREGSSGEVLNEQGRTLFQPGFMRALRKLLKS